MIKTLGLFLVLMFSPMVALAEFRVDVLTDQLERPWDMAPLPDGRFLVTERVGNLRIVDAAGQVSAPIAGLPAIMVEGQGGLLGVALHPNFATNQLVYLSYNAEDSQGTFFKRHNTEVLRGRLDGLALKDVEVIFKAQPKASGGVHFGSRLVFDRQGYLFISLGDRGERHEAQNLSNHLGTIVRLHDDGRVPEDNPFINTPNAQPEIYSYGHRNVQGMALNPATGEVWAHEHGPQGGDEVNVLRKGNNYGWPVITYGEEYVIGTKIGEGTAKPGMEQPLRYWVPSIAPSGMAFFQGELWVGALRAQLLANLTLDGNRIVDERRLFQNEFGRVRAVVSGDSVGNTNTLYLLTDDNRGKLVRLTRD